MRGSSPRVLVVSNNCFSTTGSNGRTLGGLFTGWPIDALAQFYISEEVPDSPVCEDYFRVTDRAAMRSVIVRWGRHGGTVCRADSSGIVAVQSRRPGVPKSALTQLIRNAVWRCGAWRRGGLEDWIRVFDPEVIVLQAGDAPFMYIVAREIAEELQVPLLIYNSEDYYFKTHDYMAPKGGPISRAAYPVFRRRLVAASDAALTYAAHVFHLTDDLRKAFGEVFNVPASTVMTTTMVMPKRRPSSPPVSRVSYLGNLGLGRHETLMEIASALQAVDTSLHVDVYGRAPSVDVANELFAATGIRYHGFVSYRETLEVMRQSDILVHTESFLPFYRKDIRHGFSTKIADSLASGTCLLVYAPPELASVQYLQREAAACVVTSQETLKGALEVLLSDGSLRSSLVSNALNAAARNHSSEATTQKFQNILNEVAARTDPLRVAGNPEERA